MNSLVLVAGWPFAGLLALSTRRLDADSSATCRSGIVMENDGRTGSLVLETGDATGLIEIDEGTTALFGVDGYPISLAEIRVGDLVEAIQEKRGPELVTTEIRVTWLLSSPEAIAT
jgi:hypothetical protein